MGKDNPIWKKVKMFINDDNGGWDELKPSSNKSIEFEIPKPTENKFLKAMKEAPLVIIDLDKKIELEIDVGEGEDITVITTNDRDTYEKLCRIVQEPNRTQVRLILNKQLWHTPTNRKQR